MPSVNLVPAISSATEKNSQKELASVATRRHNITIPIGLVYMVSNKCEYALRAVFELARRGDGEPTKSQEIASAQGIPPRFLEIILVELKNAGFVLARRGNSGGYALARSPREITIGQVIRLFQGELESPAQTGDADDRAGNYAFAGLWTRVQTAISGVYDTTTFEDLVQEDVLGLCNRAPDYVI